MDPSDWMVWRLVTHVRPGDVVIVGVGTPFALCAAMVAREVVDGVRVLVGPAVDPEPHDIAETLNDPSTLPARSAGVLGQRAVLGHIQRGAVHVQFVSPAQVDGSGRFNSVAVGAGDRRRWLAGPLALPDTSALLRTVVAYRADHSPRFLADEVDHVTGRGLAGVVTGAADIRFVDRDAVVVGSRRGTSFDDVRSGSGFAVTNGVVEEEMPADIVAALDRIDPQRVRDLEVPR